MFNELYYDDGMLYKKSNGRKVGCWENKGYKQFSYKRKQYLLHRAIWVKHNGVPEKGMVIDHIDDNRLNNKICNLQCITQLENVRKQQRIKGKEEYISFDEYGRTYKVRIPGHKTVNRQKLIDAISIRNKILLEVE